MLADRNRLSQPCRSSHLPSVASSFPLYDAQTLRGIRMDTYGGEDVIITTKERDIELVPRMNETVCLIFENGDGVHLGSGGGSFVDGSQPVRCISVWFRYLSCGFGVTPATTAITRGVVMLLVRHCQSASVRHDRCCQTCRAGHTWGSGT